MKINKKLTLRITDLGDEDDFLSESEFTGFKN
jgi:hypothetical protein